MAKRYKDNPAGQWYWNIAESLKQFIIQSGQANNSIIPQDFLWKINHSVNREL